MDMIVDSNAASVERHLAEVASAMPMVAAAIIRETAEGLKDDAVTAVRDHSPVGTKASGGHTPGTLRDSTQGHVEETVDGATLSVDQDAASPQGTHYMQFVAITDWNPAPVRRNYDGNPYPSDAMDTLEPEAEARVIETGVEIGAAIAARWNG